MDFILSTVAPLVFEYSIGPIARHVSYPFNYKSNVTSLEEGVKELKSARDSRQRWVNEFERNGKVIDQDVLDWLKDVGGFIEEEEAELDLANEKTKKKCCLGFCPNLKTRYQVSKKAEQKAGVVVSFSEKNGTFSTHYHTPPLQWTGGFSSKDFGALESRMSILKDIMDALTSVDVNTIGVHGVGGVGKTTLAKEVGRKAREEKLFDEVVMVTVTVDVDVINIQKTIADLLGLTFNEESKEGRAARLCQRLKNEKKILIILDDLWKKLKLEEVGIPQPDEHNGCKLLLTSRNLDVLSNEMGSQKDFSIGALAEDEAWDLFKKMADSSFDDPELQCIAKNVANVCAGLPIAIVTVASSLKSKSLPEWRVALNELNAPPSKGLTKMQAKVYDPIEFSYKQLESELQSTFLLCCQMGYNATVEDLLKYSIGLGLFDVRTLENAQDKVYSLVRTLKTRCLLLEGNSNRQLVMHDLVRDVGRWIASRDHGVVVVDDRNNPKEWADEEKIKTYTSIWLYNNVDELQEGLQCPNLVFFHIDGNDGDLQLPDNLFTGLYQLRVLSLTSFHFSSLPSSVGLLKNLKTLCFYQSQLGDISIVGELKKLEVLSFAKSNIRRLPTEIGELTKLKLLDLSGCYTLEKIPLNVLSKLSRLEELYMANSFDRWEMEGGDNASLTELKQLDSLSNLEIAIRDANLIPEGVFSKSLCRYRIFIGEGRWDWDKEGKTVKTLKLELGANINVQNGVLQLLKETQDLYLHGVKNILCELDREGFPKLKHLHLCDSPGVKYLIDMIERDPFVAFPMLETLTLENLVSLEKVCQCRLKTPPFSKLRYVHVKRCNKLTHLFSFMVAQGLLQLQEVKVSHCESMEEIVGEENKLAHCGKSEATKPIVFSQLHILSLTLLPKLKSFCSKGKQLRLSKKKSRLSKATSKQDLRTSITPLLNGQISFPNLKKLYLESIRCDTLWYGPLAAVGNSFQNLTELCVERCENMKYVFCYSLTKHLCQLKKLSLSNCKEMEEVIGMEEGSEEDEQSMNNKVIVFPELLQLRLWSLPKLKRFCKGYLLECPLLKELKIVGCPDMKTFITREHQEMRLEEMDQNATPTPLFDDMVAFPSIVEMLIEGMHNMENLWHSQLAPGSFGELRKLSIRRCEKLPKVFPSVLLGRFQKLEWLLLTDSKLVEEIFEVEGSNNHVISFQLRDLILRRLPKLKNVFPFSIATHLQKLERIDISNSGVEEIVAKAEMNGETAVFEFPELTKLRFESVPELRRWYPGMHTLMLPKLKLLAIRNATDQMPLLLPRKVFCNLEELELYGDSKIWGDDFPANLFSTLKVLSLINLGEDSWRGIPVSLLQEFHNLEKLAVDSCAFEELFSFDGSVAADVVEDHYNCTERRLPRLKHLELLGLPRMRYICEQQNHVFHLSQLFRSLETLEVRVCNSLVSVAPSSTVSFQNLTSLILWDCNKLVNIVTTTTAKSLSNLVTLEVSCCSMVTEIVEENEGEDEITFTKLQKLRLNHLRSLTSFCSGNYGFSFPCLNEVIVEECPRMKLFSPGLLLINTPKLRNVKYQNKKRWEGNLNATIQQLHTEMVEGIMSLKLSEFPELRERWHDQLLVKSFSQLESLEVDECSFISTAVPFNHMRYLGNLYNLSVSKCDSLERVFDLEKLLLNPNVRLLPKLHTLWLSDLPRLHYIFPNHPSPIFEFKDLGSLVLRNCSSLKNVLTTSMALCLVQLWSIAITNCIALEEIITEEKNAGEAAAKVQDILIFPRLRIIVLDSLPNLISFNSGSGILEFSSIEEITVDNCPNMKPFISSFLWGQVSKAVDEIQPVATTSLIDDDKVAFPTLTELRMDWNDAMEEIGRGQFQAEFFCQLRTLAIINLPDHHLTFPSHFLLRFLNVENLTLENAMFEEITIHEGTNGEGTSVGSFEQLRKLTLAKLPKIVHLAREGSPLCAIFQNLETLEVYECGILETLLPSTISFQSLTTLKVSQCHKLLDLVTCTAAKSLVLLTRMSITECQMLEQIVENEENVAESGVTLTKLECLELHCLPSLVGFSLWNCAFTFPSLKDVVVRECPKMKIFSQGVVTAPKLRRVRQTEGEEKRCWEDSLNATIQKLYMDQAMLQSSQPSSPKSSNLDVEAGQLVRNGKSPMSEGPNSEDFHEIKNQSVTKDLSPDTITKHNEAEVTKITSTYYQHCQANIDHEEDPIQDRLSTPMDIRSISQAQMDDCSTDQEKTIPPSSTEQSVNVCERSASDSCKDHFSKPVFKGLLPEHKMTQIPLTYQHSRAIAEYVQEDPTLNQSSSTAMEMGNCFVSQEQVLSDAIPTPYAAPEPAIVSTSESKNRTLSSLELTSSLFSKPSSEDFQEIKNPSVTKDLSPDTITKHIEAEEDPIQDRSLSTPMDIRSFSQAQMDDCSTDQDKTIPPSSSEQSVNVCERPASDSCKDHSSELVFKGFLPEHKMTQITSTYQHSRAIAEYDQEDPTLNQNSSTAMDMGNCFVFQEQVDLREAYKLSDANPTPYADPTLYAAPEPAIVSTSESKNRTFSSLELTSSLFSKPSSKPPTFPNTEIESMNLATSSKKPANITPSSFQPALSINTPAESCNSILETDEYSMSMYVMKNVLSKPLTEVASSTDRVLLLSTLKNLRKCQCHLLNAQQIEAIQVFIENFDSFVAYHPFHENQIEQVGAFKFCVEDKKKGIAMLKNHYEDLAQKSTSLGADKEALIKRLREIEEEEDKIREDMEDFRAKIATDSGKLEEAYTFFLPEFDRERKEAEAKVCTSNSQWAKMRSLFS